MMRKWLRKGTSTDFVTVSGDGVTCAGKYLDLTLEIGDGSRSAYISLDLYGDPEGFAEEGASHLRALRILRDAIDDAEAQIRQFLVSHGVELAG